MGAHLTRRRLWSALVATLVAGALVGPGALAAPKPPSSGVKNYTASFDPASARAGGTAVLVLYDCGTCGAARTSNTSFGSAQVTVPAGFDLSSPLLSVDRPGWSVSVVPGTTDVVLVKAGASGAAVAPGSAVRVTLPISSSARGPYTVATRVKQSNDFSGTGNDFGAVDRTTGATSDGSATVTVTARPATVTWTQQPTSVQVSTATPAVATSGVTPQLVMCPAPAARVADAQSEPVPGVAVTLGPVAGAGLSLDGSSAGVTATTDSNGIATFGTCGSTPSGLRATNLGRGYTLVASAGSPAVSSPASSPFDVLQSYGTCAADCTGALTGPSSSTKAQLQATGGTGTATFLFEGGAYTGWDAGFTAACDPDPDVTNGSNPYRDQVTVDVSSRDKRVTLTWSKTAVQWATNNGASQWQVCFATTYSFPRLVGATRAFAGPPAADAPQVGSWYVGALLPCSDARTAGFPCLSSLGRSAGSQVAVISVPGRDGDPRMI